LIRQTLVLCQNVLGHEHPHTLMSVSLLAATLASLYQYDESSALYERACAGYDIALGQQHPVARACCQAYSKMLVSREQHAFALTTQIDDAEMQLWLEMVQVLLM
jgi:hypothetical protein